MNLRQITKKDQLDLKKIYFNSIISIKGGIYSKEQKRAWAGQAWDNPNFKEALSKGKGWLIYDKENIFAFAIRYPKNRIALLYCNGRYQRRGFGSRLLHKLENEAKGEGIDYLSTEASLISYKLFLKQGWEIIRKEKIIIKNIYFERYKMIKNLTSKIYR